MLCLMNFEGSLRCYVPEEKIVDITEGLEPDKKGKRYYPYSEIHIVDKELKLDYKIRVVESKKKIEELIKQKKEERDFVALAKFKSQLFKAYKNKPEGE